MPDCKRFNDEGIQLQSHRLILSLKIISDFLPTLSVLIKRDYTGYVPVHFINRIKMQLTEGSDAAKDSLPVIVILPHPRNQMLQARQQHSQRLRTTVML
jgi:hypothetical protein